MPTVTLVVPTFPKLSETFIVNKFVGLADRGLDVHIVTQAIDHAVWGQFDSLAGRTDLYDRVHSWEGSVRFGVVLSKVSRLMHVLGQRYQSVLRYILKGLRVHGPRAVGSFCSDLLVISTMPDVIHFEFGSLATARPDLAQVVGAKMSASFRGYDLNYVGLEDHSYYQPVWDRLDGAHFLGQDLYRRALKRGCPRSLPFVLIPPSIDTNFFTPYSRGGEDAQRTQVAAGPPQSSPATRDTRSIRVLSVGRLEWKKGYEFALAAIRRVLDRGVPVAYRIIGSGEYSEAIMFAVRQLGLEEVVEVSGAMPQQQVKDAMEEADIFLHAAVSEGFCNAVIEAQAMKLPVVTSDADGLAENVVHGTTGFVVPRRDPEQMAVAIERLALDPQLRLAMGGAGRARVLEHFQIARQIDAFYEFYRNLAGEGGQS